MAVAELDDQGGLASQTESLRGSLDGTSFCSLTDCRAAFVFRSSLRTTWLIR